VTHRGLASSFAVITGHEDPSKDESAIDWARLATGVDTLVFLMGVERLAEIAKQLIANGRAGETPVAVVEWGTLPRQRTVSGTIATIADDVAAAGIGSPAVTVVGEVARLRNDLRWFDARPLSGKRVLVTRTRKQASELSRALAAAGAEPVELPALEIVRIADAAHVARCIELLRTSAYGWAIFTSANGVEMFFDELAAAGLDARAFGRTQIAAFASGTAEALARAGLRVDLPAEYIAEDLAERMARRPLRGVRVLLPRAAGARETIVDALAARGAIVDELVLYESRVPRAPDAEGLRRLRAGEIDIATFASSSSVRNLVTMLGGDVEPLRGLTIAAIGPITALPLREYGIDVHVMPERHTIEGLVEALVAHAGRVVSNGD
jgi:uroporphyrinogen III methyltransferase/synthase